MKAIYFILKVIQLLVVFTFGYLMIPIMIGLIGADFEIYWALISNPNYAVFGVLLGIILTSAFVISLPDKDQSRS
jgi:hypothetical protein